MRGTGRLLGRIGVFLALLLGLMIGLGLLITKVLQHTYPISAEDGIDRSLAAGRTPSATAVSQFFSLVGSTNVVIAVLLIVAIVFRLVFRRWRESVFLLLAVSTQVAIFVLTTLAISRRRPAVHRLDASPPTSSFPSGHTGASTALYVGIALVIAWHTRDSWARWPIVALLVAVPLSVALSRLYRGMHHPSDVLAAFVNGGLCVVIAARNLLFGALPDSVARRLDGPGARSPAVPGVSRAGG